MIDLQLPITNVNNGRTSVEQRFWAKVLPVTESGCWLWVGAVVGGWCGQLRVNGGKVYAHRVSYALHHGEIPGDALVLHRCDIASCVNPTHLFLGTSSDNAADMCKKGRYGYPNRRLTCHEVTAIRRRTVIGTKGRGGNALLMAKEYGVSRRTIYSIISGDTWK